MNRGDARELLAGDLRRFAERVLDQDNPRLVFLRDQNIPWLRDKLAEYGVCPTDPVQLHAVLVGAAMTTDSLCGVVMPVSAAAPLAILLTAIDDVMEAAPAR